MEEDWLLRAVTFITTVNVKFYFSVRPSRWHAMSALGHRVGQILYSLLPRLRQTPLDYKPTRPPRCLLIAVNNDHGAKRMSIFNKK